MRVQGGHWEPAVQAELWALMGGCLQGSRGALPGHPRVLADTQGRGMAGAGGLRGGGGSRRGIMHALALGGLWVQGSCY